MQKSWIASALSGLMLALVVAAPAAPPKKPTAKKPAAEGKVVTTPSGLKYVDLKVGTGATPKAGQMVTVNYVGTLSNGKVFDATFKHVDPQHPKGQPFEFTIGVRQVIPAWDEGVSTMKVGGKRKLTCPPNLAYGERGAGSDIPPNATLTFVVELLKVGP